MCGSVSQHIEGFFRQDFKTSYMNEHDSLESFPAGQAVTVKSDHSIRNRGAEQIATTVCGSEGDVAYIVFAYLAEDPQSPEGRNVILNSLRSLAVLPSLQGIGTVRAAYSPCSRTGVQRSLSRACFETPAPTAPRTAKSSSHGRKSCRFQRKPNGPAAIRSRGTNSA